MFDRVLVMGVLVLGGCVVDKQLGNTDGVDDGADGVAGSDGTSTGGDEGGTLGMSDGQGGSDGADDPSASEGGPGNVSMTTMATATATATDDGEGDDGDDDGGDLCEDWTPPPFDCEPDDGAYAAVLGDPLPLYQDQLCNKVGPIQIGPAGDPESVTFSLDCGDGPMPIEIVSSPFVYPSLLDNMDPVYLTTTESFEPALSGLPTFEIRSEDGTLLLAWVNELDHEIDLPLEPLEIQIGNSGCPSSNVAEKCKAGGSIQAQGVPVEFGSSESPVPVFAGNTATLMNTDQHVVIVDRSQQIVCWDDDCIGDDTGPFDRVSFLVSLE